MCFIHLIFLLLKRTNKIIQTRLHIKHAILNVIKFVNVLRHIRVQKCISFLLFFFCFCCCCFVVRIANGVVNPFYYPISVTQDILIKSLPKFNLSRDAKRLGFGLNMVLSCNHKKKRSRAVSHKMLRLTRHKLEITKGANFKMDLFFIEQDIQIVVVGKFYLFLWRIMKITAHYGHQQNLFHIFYSANFSFYSLKHREQTNETAKPNGSNEQMYRTRWMPTTVCRRCLR